MRNSGNDLCHIGGKFGYPVSIEIGVHGEVQRTLVGRASEPVQEAAFLVFRHALHCGIDKVHRAGRQQADSPAERGRTELVDLRDFGAQFRDRFFRTGDIGYVSTETCECGRTLGRIHILGRKDEMFIVGAVNVFPTDVEYVVRAEEGLTGEYVIRVYTENFTTRYEVSVERAAGSEEPYDAVSRRVEAALKAHCGVRPAKVKVYDAGKLGAESEHKASRFIDER